MVIHMFKNVLILHLTFMLVRIVSCDLHLLLDVEVTGIEENSQSEIQVKNIKDGTILPR